MVQTVNSGKHLNGTGFVITAYMTDRIKMGEKYETN